MQIPTLASDVRPGDIIRDPGNGQRLLVCATESDPGNHAGYAYSLTLYVRSAAPSYAFGLRCRPGQLLDLISPGE